jgi:hypothetical protein
MPSAGRNKKEEMVLIGEKIGSRCKWKLVCEKEINAF